MSGTVIRAVIFDFDGTLTLPGANDFIKLRSEIGCAAGVSLMAFIEGIENPIERKRAFDILEQSELGAAERSQESPDAPEVIRRFQKIGLRVGVMSNNSRRALDISFSRFANLNASMFDIVLSREDNGMKPSPDPMLFAARALDVVPEEMLVVGDYFFDILSGKSAGAVTVFLRNREGAYANRFPNQPLPDFEIESLPEIEPIVRLYSPLPEGKVPNDLLQIILAETLCQDPALIVGPGIGRDSAVIQVPQSELVVASDPITLISSDIGRYALTVNANDVAASGADPRWFLTTILMPPGTIAEDIRTIMTDISAACDGAGVCLCGGHTEITGAVTRPVISGTMFGLRDSQTNPKAADFAQGDPIYMTKEVGIEGTAILVTLFRDLLMSGGIDSDTLGRAASYSERISIVNEAKAARKFSCIMHDVTEGGIATAVEEFSMALSRSISIDLDLLPISAETEKICSVLGVDPLGLIGSGSLLLSVAADRGQKVEEAVGAIGVDITKIGSIGPAGEHVIVTRSGETVELPRFGRDELARLLAATE